MSDLSNAILMIILAMNLFALGTSRIPSLIRLIGFQGALLGVVALLSHEHLTAAGAVSAAAAVGLKGFVIPAVMMRALRNARIKREVEPLIGYMASIMLGAAATVLALLLSGEPAELGRSTGTLLVPAALATTATGFILLAARFKALTQIIGYLVLENGIYIFSIVLIEAIPIVVEMGILLDLFVGVFVISIITNHINRAFSSMDTRHLASLKE